ncbi:MAG: hypothetical protein WAL04_19665 [Acidimicrobiales bacterium]
MHTLRDPDVVRLQESYVRRVIDTVGEFDNVMYEIGNEHEGTPANNTWQFHMIDVVHEYEAARPMQHPVLMTAAWPLPSNDVLCASAAEAVSPMHWNGRQFDHWPYDPPARYLGKVVIADTDHLWGVGGDADWVWRTFTRGHNVLYMDPYGYLHMDPVNPDGDEGARRAMGRCAKVSRSIDLAEMLPRTDLTSSGFALVAEGREYLIYHPYGDRLFADLAGMEGPVAVEWLHPVEDRAERGADLPGNSVVRLRPPSVEPWAVRLFRA